MFVELVYDKRNSGGLAGVKGIVLGELSKRVHRVFPDADIRVEPMMALPAIDTSAGKHGKEQVSRIAQEMLKEADVRLVNERTMDNLIISDVRIYFPKPGERLPVPPDNLRNFAIRGIVGGRCCPLMFM